MLLTSNSGLLECGTDEAGRGCLAGPVTAAAVILPLGFDHKLINDSKKLTHKQREELRSIIESKVTLYSIAHVFPKQIDKINILNASIQAMHIAISNLKQQPQHILVDGNRFHAYTGCTHACIIKGDGKYLSIATASILAKTERDRYMEKLHEEFPYYNWKKNKGYPTKEHRDAIREYGLTMHHRKSFRQLPEQLKLAL